jgi:signal transduction histidine kinase
LDVLGVGAAIRWQAEEYAARTDVEFQLEIAESELDAGTELDPEVRITVFRIAQEALTNVLRHSGADKVRVTYREGKGTLLLEVADDGVGISRKEVLDRTSLGLVGMRERALAIGGELTVESPEGRGTVVRLRVGGGAEATGGGAP